LSGGVERGGGGRVPKEKKGWKGDYMFPKTLSAREKKPAIAR